MIVVTGTSFSSKSKGKLLMEHERGDSFPMIVVMGTSFGSKSKEKVSPRSHSVQIVKKCKKYIFVNESRKKWEKNVI